MGRVAELFVRDDDACAATPQLERLLSAIGTIPLGLSVLPGLLEESLVERLATAPATVQVWHHGWTHANWATEGCSEYPATRAIEEVEAELARGKAILAQAFGKRSNPVFVPPWSGFHETFLPLLDRLGFVGFSSNGRRRSPYENRVAVFNGHCEPLEWTPQPGFGEDASYLFDIVDHLARRRQRSCDRDEPTGIIWHHRHQDDRSYGFLSKLIEVVDGHKAAAWCDPIAKTTRLAPRDRPRLSARNIAWLRPVLRPRLQA